MVLICGPPHSDLGVMHRKKTSFVYKSMEVHHHNLKGQPEAWEHIPLTQEATT